VPKGAPPAAASAPASCDAALLSLLDDYLASGKRRAGAIVAMPTVKKQ